MTSKILKAILSLSVLRLDRFQLVHLSAAYHWTSFFFWAVQIIESFTQSLIQVLATTFTYVHLDLS